MDRLLVSTLNNLDQNPHSVLEKESVEKSCSNKLEAISLVLPGCWLLISVWKWTSWFRVLGPIVHFILCIHCGRNSKILSKNYKTLLWINRNQLTGSPHLMRISLLWISLVRFFKTFEKYLANAFWGLFILL